MATNAALAYKEHAALTRLETAIGKLAERFDVTFTPAPYYHDARFYEAKKLETYADFLEKLEHASAPAPSDDDELPPDFVEKLIADAFARYIDVVVDGPGDAAAFNDAVLYVLAGGESEPDAPQSDETAPPSDESAEPASETDAASSDAPDANVDDGPADENQDGVVDEAEAKKEAEREKRRARDAARKAKELAAFDAAASNEGP